MSSTNQPSDIKNLKRKIPLQARLLRRSARRAWQTIRYGSLRKSPVFFANSFPKSGTHLLTQVLKGFTHLGPAVDSGLPAVTTFDGFTGRQRFEGEILVDLERCLPGDITYGHLHAFPAVVNFLCKEGMVTYFILRDPRDVVVSHVHYVAEMAPNHIHHRYYHNTLKTFDERVRTSIVGVSAEELSVAMGIAVHEPLPNIRARFEPYLGWLECPEVLILYYEDFITQRRETIEKVFDHAIKRGFAPNLRREDAIEVLEKCIDPHRSPTFRSGKIGSWRDAFNQEHRRLFKQVSGSLLSQLEYEEGNEPSDS